MATGAWIPTGESGGQTVSNGLYVLKRTVNMTDAIADAVDSITGVATNILTCLTIPIDTLVLSVAIEVTTVSDIASSTIDIGDETNDDGWDAEVDVNALATTNGDGAFCLKTLGGKLYTAADTIDITIHTASQAIPKLIFDIWAVCVPLI